jgi:hypothetical protein
MLVYLDRHRLRRTLTVTATALPAPGMVGGPLPPVVAVLGAAGRTAGLTAHLPPGWTVRRPRDLDDVRRDEIVLLSGATEHDVITARAVLPRRTRVVALVDDGAPPALVAGVLTAGADACVRGGLPAILAGHLVACHRRLHHLDDPTSATAPPGRCDRDDVLPGAVPIDG